MSSYHPKATVPNLPTGKQQQQQRPAVARYAPLIVLGILCLLVVFLSTTKADSQPVGGIDYSKLKQQQEQEEKEEQNRNNNHHHGTDNNNKHEEEIKKLRAENPQHLDEDALNFVEHKKASKNPHAQLKTAIGSVFFELLPEAAPKTVENFIKLIEAGFFSKRENTPPASFYRAEMNENDSRYDFCLQGGGWPVKGSPFPPLKHEYNAKFPNVKYAVSMARTADPNSATSEFSIMLTDNSKWLGPKGSEPYGYAVFAHVVEGFDVIEKFRKMAKDKKGGLTYLKKRVEFIDAKVL